MHCNAKQKFQITKTFFWGWGGRGRNISRLDPAHADASDSESLAEVCIEKTTRSRNDSDLGRNSAITTESLSVCTCSRHSRVLFFPFVIAIEELEASWSNNYTVLKCVYAGGKQFNSCMNQLVGNRHSMCMCCCLTCFEFLNNSYKNLSFGKLIASGSF